MQRIRIRRQTRRPEPWWSWIDTRTPSGRVLPYWTATACGASPSPQQPDGGPLPATPNRAGACCATASCSSTTAGLLLPGGRAEAPHTRPFHAIAAWRLSGAHAATLRVQGRTSRGGCLARARRQGDSPPRPGSAALACWRLRAGSPHRSGTRQPGRAAAV